MERDNADIIGRIAAVAEPSATVDEIAAVRMHCRSQLDLWKERCRMVDEAMVDHIEATGEPLVIGATEYRAGHPTKKKNRPEQKRRTFLLLVDACDGDLEAVADCLYNDPFKVSEAEARLTPAEFAECFEVVTEKKLVEGKARKQLMQAWEPKR